MKPIILLFNKYFLKSKTSILYNFFFPFFIVVLVTLLFVINFDANAVMHTSASLPSISMLSPIYLIPSVSTVSIVCLSLLSLPLFLNDLKQTNILKKISINISNFYFFFCLFIIFFIYSFLLYVVCFIISSCLVYVSINTNKNAIIYMVNNINVLSLLFSILIYSFLACTIGILISLVFKNINSIQIFGIILILFILIIGGSGIPIQYQAISKFYFISNFIPLKYPLLLILESCLQGPVINQGEWNSCSWENYLFSGFDSLNFSELKTLGYTSIFNFSHPFSTNLFPIPYMDYSGTYQDGTPWELNSWYLQKNHGLFGLNFSNFGFPITIGINDYKLASAIWAAYWTGIDISDLLSNTGGANISITSIPIITLADNVQKILDFVVPLFLSIIAWFYIFKSYQRKMIYEETK